MALDPGPVHESLHRLIDASTAILSAASDTTPNKGSKRADERHTLIRTHGGGGRSRANLHDRLNRELRPFLANIGILVSGVADLFESGLALSSRGLNTPALTVLIRAPLEAASQMMWLLDDQIDPSERVRRYLIWMLHDLASQRATVDLVGDTPPKINEQLQAKEDLILEWVSDAKWEALPRRTSKRGKTTPAALRNSSGNDIDPMPSKTTLVNRFVGADMVYTLLSVSAHGDRWAITDTMTVTDQDARDGRKLAKITGFGLSTNMLKSSASAAIVLPTMALARWNAIDASALNSPIERLNAVTFNDDPDE